MITPRVRLISLRIWKHLAIGCVVGALAAAAAEAKVVFTGYGDFQFDASSRYDLSGSPSTLNSLGTGPGDIEARGFNVNSLGLFASSDLSDNVRALINLTFSNIGSTTKTTSIQYGYVEYSAYGGEAQAGKIILPFNYYNQNRFYPFQRASISAPVFQSAILGLPIADIGATAGRTFDVDDVADFRVDVYAVNGYSSLNGSSTTFRSPGVLGGLSIANNITGQDANHRITFGGRAEAGPNKALDETSVGVSYYRDEWGPQGQQLFQMIGSHVHASYAGFDFLAEYLQLDVTGDQGMLANFGSKNWRTDGFFMELDYKKLSAWKKPVTPWVRFEDDRSRGTGGGDEALWEDAGGISIGITNGLTAKFEADRLYYRLPYQGLSDLTLRGYSFLTGLTVTF